MDADRHACSETGVECADLGVDVRQIGGVGPSPHLHDGRVRGPLEFERHRSGCSEGMGANAAQIVALGDQLSYLVLLAFGQTWVLLWWSRVFARPGASLLGRSLLYFSFSSPVIVVPLRRHGPAAVPAPIPGSQVRLI
jgi:hypothetical protein